MRGSGSERRSRESGSTKNNSSSTPKVIVMSSLGVEDIVYLIGLRRVACVAWAKLKGRK